MSGYFVARAYRGHVGGLQGWGGGGGGEVIVPTTSSSFSLSKYSLASKNMTDDEMEHSEVLDIVRAGESTEMSDTA